MSTSQDIYFPRRPAVENIAGAYHLSSLLLLIGVVVFTIIFLIAVVSLCKVVFRLRAYRKSVEYNKEKHMKEMLSNSSSK